MALFTEAPGQEISCADEPDKMAHRYGQAVAWHMGARTQNAPDWGIDFLNAEHFDSHLKRLREAGADYLA